MHWIYLKPLEYTAGVVEGERDALVRNGNSKSLIIDYGARVSSTYYNNIRLRLFCNINLLEALTLIPHDSTSRYPPVISALKLEPFPCFDLLCSFLEDNVYQRS